MYFIFLNLQTPDGIVKLKHFRAVIRNDGGERHLGLKIAHKLTHDHLHPQYYQKMNLGMVLDVSK